MKWRRLGRIFCPDGSTDWMRTHASTPVVELLGGSHIRVFFSGRDVRSRSSIACFEFDVRRPGQAPKVIGFPLVTPGVAGFFDDSGASMGCLVRVERTRYLYYVGWNLGVTVPWRNSIGLAISEDDSLVFQKVSDAPLLDRSHDDPYSLSYPWITRDGGLWRMWYGSNTSWGPTTDSMRHVIKYAESTDGVTWDRRSEPVLPLLPGETAVARPCVIDEAEGLRMWYSARDQRYRIRSATSSDGLSWLRSNEGGLEPSGEPGWDSEMVAYPCVFTLDGETFMLYNGNGYGRTGIGLAIRDD